MRTPQAILALLAIGACGIPALAQQKWTAYRYPDQGFSIAFPGEPRLAAKPLAGKYPLTRHDYLFAAGNNVFEVTVLEYADGPGPDKVDVAHLSGLIASYVRGSGSTLRTQNLVTLAGVPGLEGVSEDGTHDRCHLVDVLAAGARIYLVVSEGPKGHETSAAARRFRDSFRLIK